MTADVISAHFSSVFPVVSVLSLNYKLIHSWCFYTWC